MKMFLVAFRIVGSQILNANKSAGISIIVLNTLGDKWLLQELRTMPFPFIDCPK